MHKRMQHSVASPPCSLSLSLSSSIAPWLNKWSTKGKDFLSFFFCIWSKVKVDWRETWTTIELENVFDLIVEWKDDKSRCWQRPLFFPTNNLFDLLFSLVNSSIRDQDRSMTMINGIARWMYFDRFLRMYLSINRRSFLARRKCRVTNTSNGSKKKKKRFSKDLSKWKILPDERFSLDFNHLSVEKNKREMLKRKMKITTVEQRWLDSWAEKRKRFTRISTLDYTTFSMNGWRRSSRG